MERVPVKSSNIKSVGYESSTQLLEIEFLKSGIYQFLNVEQNVHIAFMAAPSKGIYFDRNIKDKYPTKKIR